jgi:GNAT superfamily N-acetyltransferase
MIIRKILPEELDVTVNLFRYYAQEAGETNPNLGAEFDSDSVVNTIRNRTIHGEMFWFNAIDNTRPVGFVSGCLTAAPWNENVLYAHIDMIFVLKEHRNIDLFKKLISHAEDWARTFECQKLSAGDIGINPERSRTLYSSLGFDETVYMTRTVE